MIAGAIWAVFLAIFASDANAKPNSSELSYSVVIDAGSSGTRANIFQHSINPQTNLPIIGPVMRNGKEMRCSDFKRGISSFYKNPSELSQALEPMVTCLRDSFNDFTDASKVDLYVFATAGIRNLPTQKDQDTVMAKATEIFENSGLNARKIGIIDGSNEGIYTWLTINDIMKTLGSDETYGTIEMGGGSLQIVFAPEHPPKEHDVQLSVGEKTYHLYSYSYPTFGFYASQNHFLAHDCVPAGIRGKRKPSDFAKCHDAIVKHHSFREDPSRGEHLGIGNVYQPPVHGNFIALGSIGSMAKDFGIYEMIPKNMHKRIAEDICGKNVDELKMLYPNPSKPIADACFKTTYISALLSGHKSDKNRDGFGFDHNSKQITGAKRLKGHRISWPRGFLYKTLMEKDAR